MDGMAKNKFQGNSGPSQRQLRVGELIRRTLSDVLMRGELHDPDLSRMSITVGEVRVSPDLRIATAFVLPLGGDGAEEAVQRLARHQGELRHVLGKQIKLKHVPELRFRVDDTFERMDRTREIFADEKVRQDLDD